jgi:preprotein translocase subunit SecD
MGTLGFLIALLAAGPQGFTIAGEPFAQADILDARTVPDGSGSAALLITFTPKGAAHLKTLTASHDGKAVPVALDGTTLSQPVVHGPIDDGQLEIEGDFGGFDAAATLAKRISGKDPVPEGGE